MRDMVVDMVGPDRSVVSTVTVWRLCHIRVRVHRLEQLSCLASEAQKARINIAARIGIFSALRLCAHVTNMIEGRLLNVEQSRYLCPVG